MQNPRRKLHDDLDALTDEQLPVVQRYLEALAAQQEAPSPRIVPRILAPERSYWLHEDQEVTLVRGKLRARRVGVSCRLMCAPEAVDAVRVNGVPVRVDERALSDGDFIQLGGARFIFQADPVAAKRARGGTAQPPAYLGEKTRAKATLSAEGIGMGEGHPAYSLWTQSSSPVLRVRASGMIRWDEIACLNISTYRHTTSVNIRPIDALAGEVRPRLPAWLYGVFPLLSFMFGSGEAHGFLDWVRAVAPVDPSVHGAYHYRRLLPDAYLAAAEALIAARGPGALPAPEGFIRGRPTRTQRTPGVLMVLAAVLLGAVCCGLASVLPQGVLGFFVVMGILASIMLGIFGIMRLDHQSSYWRESGLLEDLFDREKKV